MYQRKTKNQKPKTKNQNINVKNKKDKKLSVIGNQSSNNILPGQIKIISAWIYPAESPKGKEIFIPDEAWEELQKN